MVEIKKWPMFILTAIELERPETQSAFRDYIVKHYPGIAVEEVLKQVGKWPDYLWQTSIDYRFLKAKA